MSDHPSGKQVPTRVAAQSSSLAASRTAPQGSRRKQIGHLEDCLPIALRPLPPTRAGPARGAAPPRKQIAPLWRCLPIALRPLPPTRGVPGLVEDQEEIGSRLVAPTETQVDRQQLGGVAPLREGGGGQVRRQRDHDPLAEEIGRERSLRQLDVVVIPTRLRAQMPARREPQLDPLRPSLAAGEAAPPHPPPGRRPAPAG